MLELTVLGAPKYMFDLLGISNNPYKGVCETSAA